MPTRRHLLATVGLAATGAGCMGALGDGDAPSDADDAGSDDAGDESQPTDEPDDGDEPEDVEEQKTVRMERLSVRNQHDAEHRVQLAVEGDGEILHLGTYDLEENSSSVRIEGDWSQRDAAYRIHARLDDGDIRTTDVTEGVGASVDCVHVQVQVDEEGSLAIWYGGHCG